MANFDAHLDAIRALRNVCTASITWKFNAETASTSQQTGEHHRMRENVCGVSSEDIKVEVKDEELDF